MRVDKTTFLLIIDFIFIVLAYAFGTDMSIISTAVVTLITLCLEIKSIININDHGLTLTSSLLLYMWVTQFGLFVPYAFFGKSVLSNYSDYTLRFLENAYLVKAVILGNIAVLTFDIIRRITCSYYRKNNYYLSEQTIDEEMDGDPESLKLYYVSIIMLITVIMYFGYNVLSGGMTLFGTYQTFMNSSAYNNNLYSYVLILFYVGTIYLASAGNIMNHKIGWGLWLLLVFIFALNGNKGEFLYALLVVLGIKGLQGQKINFKVLLIGGLLLFFVIPSITALRSIGIVNNLSGVRFNFFDAFVEMGMQIRTSVYSLDDLSSGKVSFLLGKSYWKPIVNIINPFSTGTATAQLRSLYPGYGYSQVIESYMNFGVCGTLLYFSVIGYVLGKFETTFQDKLKLAYYGTITCIFINASRNYFAFVPGQIIIVTIIYLFTKYFKVQNL